MAPNSISDSMPENGIGMKLKLTRVFDAPRRLLFKVWTDPTHLAAWWGPQGFTNPRCEWDARADGLIRIDMRAFDGRVYPMSGKFREVVPPEKIVFLSAALDEAGNPMFEVLNTVTFTENAGKTTLTLTACVVTATAHAPQYLKGMEMGWTQSLERLAAQIRKALESESAAAGGDAKDREIVITRVFDAPRELVWDAWTDPKQIVQWWGPRGFTTTIDEMDVRAGGNWKQTMHGPDGTDYPNQSTFIEVAKPEKIVYSLQGGEKGGRSIQFEATWTFEALGDQTRLTMRMVFPSAEVREFTVKVHGAIEGGNQTLDRLQEHLAKVAAAAR